MRQNNVILEKSYRFALRVVKLYIHLRDKNEFHLSAQLVRSGTSVGANVEEAIGGSSRRDFKAKLSIAFKEAKETRYWIRLLKDSGLIDNNIADSFIKDVEEIIKILTAILNTLKSN